MALNVASSATILAVATGFGLHCTSNKGSRACSTSPSTISGGSTVLSNPTCIAASFNSAIFGDQLKLRQNHPTMAHAQPAPTGPVTSTPAIRAAASVKEATKEPVTGIEFPNNLTSPGASTELVLVGVGVREKKVAFLKVKVYALGFYVDATSLRGSSVGVWKGRTGTELAKDDAFYKALMEAPLEKALRIVFDRDIQGSQFTGALDEALLPRLKANAGGPAADDALAAFRKVFDGRALKKGTAVFITWSQPSTLHVAIYAANEANHPSPQLTSIDSAILLSSLFDVYLGKDPVSPSAKVSVANGCSSLL